MQHNASVFALPAVVTFDGSLRSWTKLTAAHVPYQQVTAGLALTCAKPCANDACERCLTFVLVKSVNCHPRSARLALLSSVTGAFVAVIIVP